VIDANEAYLKIIGAESGQVEAGQVNIHEITPPEYRALDEDSTEQVLTQGFCRPYEKEYLRQRWDAHSGADRLQPGRRRSSRS
jgi:PAS domain-containing protein